MVGCFDLNKVNQTLPLISVGFFPKNPCLLSSSSTHHNEHDLQPFRQLGPSHYYHTNTNGGMRVALPVSSHRYDTGNAPKMKILHSDNCGFRVK